MTALDARDERAQTKPAPAVEEEQKPKVAPRQVAMRRTIRISAIALVIGVVGFVIFQLFEGPYAQAWYSTRQHQLASQLGSAVSHQGKGRAIAYLQIPRLGTNLVVAEGDSPQQLRSGPGHRIGTPLPGDVGNSVIAGHRGGWGGSFNDLSQLKTGDYIVVQLPWLIGNDGSPRTGVFKVTSIQGASSSDVQSFAPSTDRRITIVTGTGGEFSSKRTIITAVSGTAGSLQAPTSATRATTGGGSALFNRDVLLAVVAFAGAILVGVLARKRYRLPLVIAVVTPFVVLGLLGLLLDLDAAMPPFR
jgi:LPXTG-site transpeptidase (sortase) family protein